MVLFPNCKINLGLRVSGKRADGFHDIETIFLPLSLKDAAELNTCNSLKSPAPPPFELILAGTPVPGDPENNLCKKAWQLIKADFPDLPPVKMHLLKAIPPGAGLAGGSSNGAFTLLLLNQHFRLGLEKKKLLEYAMQLGSDCPFFIVNKPCYATGRGEMLEEIPLDVTDHVFVLVYPGIHILTAWAFSQLGPRPEQMTDLRKVVALPVGSWKEHLVNDFESPVFAAHPQLRDIKEKLYASGAVYASLTGTGSCVYGIFNATDEAKRAAFNDGQQVYRLRVCE